MRVLHIITGLTRGGAEVVLCRLQERFSQQFPDVENHVVILGRTDPHLLARLRQTGAVVTLLGGTSRASVPLLLYKLYRYMRGCQPEVIQGWMYDGNLAALAARLFSSKRARVCWNIRHSFYSAGNERFSLRLVIGLNKLLSRFAAHIIYNSNKSLEQHVALGFSGRQAVVIPNGFDTEVFTPDAAASRRVRQALSIGDDAVVFGNVARLHPMKGQVVLIDTFSRLASDAHLLIIGGDAGVEPAALTLLANRLGVGDRVHLLGLRDDVVELMCALDVLVCASRWGEAFPNAVGEAMACAVPCVVTDLGDSALLLGEGGLLVPPGDTQALASAMQALYDMPPEQRSAMGRSGRQRVIEKWSLDQVADSYHALYFRAEAQADAKGAED